MSTAVKEAPTEQGAEAGEKAPRSKKKLILDPGGGAGRGRRRLVLLPQADGLHAEAGRDRAPGRPIQINLAGGHYLRIGLALQLTDSASKEIDGSKALDATIDLFSGLPDERGLPPEVSVTS